VFRVSENQIGHRDFAVTGFLRLAGHLVVKTTSLIVLLSAIWLGSLEAAARSDGGPPILRNARNQFVVFRPPKPAPTTIIMAEDGGVFELRRFRGKLILLNFWATWCAPCVRELPALDRLQALLGSEDLEIVALSIDDAGIEKPVSFVRGLGLEKLRVYLDFEEMAIKGFPLYGLPISYLIDRQGLLIGYIVGAVEWDSPEAVGLLNYYIQNTRADAGG
jgi:thiol-disulfide isomerase/thioredoxin